MSARRGPRIQSGHRIDGEVGLMTRACELWVPSGDAGNVLQNEEDTQTPFDSIKATSKVGKAYKSKIALECSGRTR